MGITLRKNLCDVSIEHRNQRNCWNIFFLKMLALGCIIFANFVSFLNSIQDVQQVWSEWCLNLPITSFATGLPGFSFRSEDSTELCKFQPWHWHIKEFHVRLNEIFRCSKSCAFLPLSMTKHELFRFWHSWMMYQHGPKSFWSYHSMWTASLPTENASNPRSQYNKSQGLKDVGHLEKTQKTLNTLDSLFREIKGTPCYGQN